MPESQTQSTPDRMDALFDRYTLPKIALAVILAASLVGAWVTTTLNGSVALPHAVAKWAYFVALGVLTGGFVWKHLFVRPVDLGDEAAEYCAEMYDRFDRIAAATIAVFVVAAPAVFWGYLRAFDLTTGFLGYVALVAIWIVFAVLTTRRKADVSRQFRSPAGLVALGVALSVVVATAVAEVAMRGPDPVTAAVRSLHLLAFAVWIGGAVWNIFVAVPTGQKRPTVQVVRAAGEQLERFRWAVRFIIPTIFLTGLYQAVEGLGTDVSVYLGSSVGLAVLAKVGFIGLLVGIFKLCPMWRACSPIEGVCELEDLAGGGSEENEPPDRDPVGDPIEMTGHD